MSSSPKNQDRLVAEIRQLEAEAALKLAQALELRKLLDGAPSLSTALYGAKNVRQCICIVVKQAPKEKVWTVDNIRFELLQHGRHYSHAYIAEMMGRMREQYYIGVGGGDYLWAPPFFDRIAAGKYMQRVSS